MAEPPIYQLFFIASHRHFKEGTLFELASQLVTEASINTSYGQKFNTIPEQYYDNYGYLLPDRGDGIPEFLSRDDVIACPPFSENVPPGRCPVEITYQRVRCDADPLFDANVNGFGISAIRVESNLHFQKIILSLPNKMDTFGTVTVVDRLKGLEIDGYESPTLETDENGPAYGLHIGHLGPGFYEAKLSLGRAKFIRLRFIKFFPPEFTARYETARNAYTRSTVPERQAFSMPVNLIHSHMEDNDGEFPSLILNHALSLATEWGENFRKPIDSRMSERFPELRPDDIEKITALVRKAEYHIYRLAEQEMAGLIAERDIVPLALKKYPWMDKSQASRLAGIGMYYSRR